MMERKNQYRKPPFNGPPYHDRSPAIFHDLTRAWQSIDILKEKLQCTEKKLRTIGNEPLDLESLTSGQHARLDDGRQPIATSRVRKRKVFRLEDRIKPEGSDPPSLFPHAKKEVQWKILERKDKEKEFHGPDWNLRDSTIPNYLNTDEFERFKKGQNDAIGGPKPNDAHSDLSLVPIRLLNDDLQLTKEDPYRNDAYERSMSNGPRLTHVDVDLVRPSFVTFAPTPPATLPVDRAGQRPSSGKVSRGAPPSEIPVVKMAWVPIDTSLHRSTKQPVIKEIVAKTIENTFKATRPQTVGQSVAWQIPFDKPSNQNQSTSSTNSIKISKPVKAMKRKRGHCLPSKIQQSVINPYSWRRGQEIILKELGPFKRPVQNEKPAPNDKSNDDATTLSSVFQLPKDSKFESKNKEQKQVISNSDSKNERSTKPSLTEESKTDLKNKLGNNRKSVSKKGLRNSKDVNEEELRQSTPKLRHYDSDNIRKYIKAQREERRKKKKEEKLAESEAKEQQRLKLNELQARQRELAKVGPSQSSKAIKLSKSTGMRDKVMETKEWQWMNEIPEKASPPSDFDLRDDQDYIWDRVLYSYNLPIPRKVVRKRKSQSISSRDASSGTVNSNEIGWDQERPSHEVHQDVEPKSHGDGMDVTANERLKSLSHFYNTKMDSLINHMQNSNWKERRNDKEKKVASIRQQALLLQGLIDEETNKLNAKLRPRSEPTVNGQSEMKSDDPIGLNVAQLVSRLIENRERQSSGTLQGSGTSLSEGSLHSNDRWSQNNDASLNSTNDIERRIAVNTVIAKTELQLSKPETKDAKVIDWKSFIPPEAPDPYNFFNILSRKQANAKVESPELGIQDSGSITVDIPEVNGPSGGGQSRYSSDFEQSLTKASASGDLADAKSAGKVHSNTGTGQGSPLPHSLRSNVSSSESYEVQKRLSIENHTSSKKSISNRTAEPSLSPESSISLSQHSLSSEQLSEGTLTSSPDISQILGTSVRQGKPKPKDGSHSDKATSGPRSSHSEYQQSSILETKNSVHLSSNGGRASEESDSRSLKMSPNTLRLRMTTELSYLDNIQESLGHVQELERIRSIAIAQQEAMAFAQSIQLGKAQRNEHAKKNEEQQNVQVDTDLVQCSPSIQKLLQSQTEVNKISAEAAKQLVEINKTILEQHERQTTRDSSIKTTETVAAAAAAAVTAAISQLKHKLQQKARSLKLESSSTVSISSERSSNDDDASESSQSPSSGNSQSRGRNDASVTSGNRKSLNSSTNSRNTSQGTISEDIQVDGEGTGGPSSDPFSRPVMDEELEERSFRMLLPSESHRRSSLGQRSRRTSSPASDQSKQSSISEICPEELPLTSVDNAPVDGAGLFSGENSFQQFTLGMVKQYMEEEEMRSHHQKAISQLQEEASLRQTKDELAWTKLQKQQGRIKGEDDKMPRADKKKVRKTETNAEKNSENLDENEWNQSENSVRTSQANTSSEVIDTEIEASVRSKGSPEHSEPASSVTDKLSSSDVKSELSASAQDAESESQTATRSNGKSKMLALPSSPSTTQVLQGLKKLQVSKRYLTKREQKLLQRRKNVEELLRWQQELDKEELKVQEMEQKALEILGDKQRLSASTNTTDTTQKTETSKNGAIHEISSKKQLNESGSIVEQLALANESARLSESSMPEELPSFVESVNNYTEKENSSTSTKLDVNLKTVPIKSAAESMPSYSQETFEKISDSSASILASKMDAALSPPVVAPIVTAVIGKTADPSSPKSKSIVLRSPLTPIRTLARKRCDSSGSEDSCTISQSETASEPSDIEGRIHALKKDLRQRKNEAERLRKEQKRKNKERLKAQEASLLKQIEAYDRYISQAKLDLQKELEQDGQSKISVRPVIKQPKVAESKRLQRQTALDKSPEPVERKLSEQVSSRMQKDNLDGTENASQLTSLESGEESFESTKSTTSVSGGTQREISQEAEESTLTKISFRGSKGKDLERERSLEEMTVAVTTTKIENGATITASEMKDGPDGEEASTTVGNIEDGNSNVETMDNVSFIEDVLTKMENEDTDVSEILEREKPLVEDQLGSGDFVPRLSRDELDNSFLEETSAKTLAGIKDARKMNDLADVITESLLQRLLADEARNLANRKMEGGDGPAIYPKTAVEECHTEKFHTDIDGEKPLTEPDKDVSHRIADNLLSIFLDEEISLALDVRRRAANYVESFPRRMSDCSAESEEEMPTPKRESSVSQRVSDILAEMSEKKSPVGANTRQQDLLFLSFPSTFAEDPMPSEVTPKATDSPVKSGPNSPVRRPSSPIFGEPGELGPLELEARLLALKASEGFDTDELLTDQEWFDDDFGLTEKYPKVPPVDGAPIQHYQIYPYQDSYYIREIPNKPPPPYTPPGQATTTTLSPFTLLDTSSDLKRLTTDVIRAVNYDDDDIKRMVEKAAVFFQGKFASETETGEAPDDFFSPDDKDDDIASRSRRIYQNFILKLSEEIVGGIYESKKPDRAPWLKPEWPTKAKTAAIPKTTAEFVEAVQAKAMDLLSERKAPLAQGSHLLKWGRKKRDFVDEILLQELRKEEAEWVTYDEDEVAVKTQLTDAIFDELIEETLQIVREVYLKKEIRMRVESPLIIPLSAN